MALLPLTLSKRSDHSSFLQKRALPPQLNFKLTKSDTVLFSSAKTKDSVDLYQAMKNRWMRNYEFDSLIAQHEKTTGNNFLGELPPELIHVLGDGKVGFQKLNQLANLLRDYLKAKENWEDQSPYVRSIQSLIAPATVEILNSGKEGTVFTLGDDQKFFAFKVFKRGSGIDLFRFSTFTKAQGAKDIMQTYAVSDSRDINAQANWLLSECVLPLTKEKWDSRGPYSLAEVCKKFDLYVLGDFDRVHGVLVDPMVTKHRLDHIPKISDADFEQMIRLLQANFDQVYTRATSHAS